MRSRGGAFFSNVVQANRVQRLIYEMLDINALGNFSRLGTASDAMNDFTELATNTKRTITLHLGYGRSVDMVWVERGSTNFCLRNEDFNHGYWSKLKATVTPNDAEAPDGSNTADKLVENNDLAGIHQFRSSNITVSNATEHTAAVWAKKAERDWIRLHLEQTTDSFAYFDLTNGVTGTTGNVDKTGIVEHPKKPGWYLCWFRFTTDSTSVQVKITLAEADNDQVYDGDGTSGAHIWRPQLEPGAHPTSSIKTEGVTVTRNAERFYADLTSLPEGGLGTDEGGLVMYTFRPYAIDYNANSYFYRNKPSTGGTNARAFATDAAVGNINFGRKDNLSTVNAITSTDSSRFSTPGVLQVFKHDWKENDIEGYDDGVSFNTDINTGSSFVTVTEISIGNSDNGTTPSKHLDAYNWIGYFDRRGTDIEASDLFNAANITL